MIVLLLMIAIVIVAASRGSDRPLVRTVVVVQDPEAAVDGMTQRAFVINQGDASLSVINTMDEAAIERDTAVYQRSFARGKGFQLVKRLSDEPRKVAVVGFLDPAVERASEDSDRDLGREARGGLSETAPS